MGQEPGEGILNIRGCQRRTVAEGHIFPQMKGICSPVFGNLPGPGQGRQDQVSVGGFENVEVNNKEVDILDQQFRGALVSRLQLRRAET